MAATEQTNADAGAVADSVAAAMVARDAAALRAHFADDVVLHSPVTPIPFRGAGEVGALMEDIIASLDAWERTWHLAQGDTCAFTARAVFGGRECELMELLRIDRDGRIVELRIHGRPLAGVAAIAAAAGPRIARRRSRARARAVAAIARPLPALLARGDALVARLAR